MRYSIEDTTLTALGDATRRFVGNTRVEHQEIKESHSFKLYTLEGESSYNYRLGNIALNFKVKLVEASSTAATYEYSGLWGRQELEFDSNNEALCRVSSGGSIVIYITNKSDEIFTCVIEVTALDNQNNALTKEVTVENTLTPVQMAEELNAFIIPAGGLDEENLVITGDCKYRFSYGGWDWFIEKYGRSMTTTKIDAMGHMFDSSNLSFIPFDLNGNFNMSTVEPSYLFANARNLTNVPKMSFKAQNMNYMFNGCYRLREIPEESYEGIDFSPMDNATSAYTSNCSNLLYGCFSLRTAPIGLLKHGCPTAAYSYSIYSALFQTCYALDEVVNLPVIHTQATWTSNVFGSTFKDCNRVKNIIFALQEDGSPYVCSGWKKQTIDLTSNVGWCVNVDNIIEYNSGITLEKRVSDAATYQALKDDPDWFTTNVAYSRYNHDSAVATINSLPDCSAVGGNIIKFKGAAGSATDGGAINTLTEEEIAVAAARGWTVTLA